MDRLLFFEHGPGLGDVHGLIRLIDPLLQQGDKIIDQIIGKVEVIPQVVGDEVDVFLNIAAIEVKSRIWHGHRLEKSVGIKVVVVQKGLEPGFPLVNRGCLQRIKAPRIAAGLARHRILLAVKGLLVGIHPFIRHFEQLGKIFFTHRRPDAAHRQAAILADDLLVQPVDLPAESLLADVVTHGQEFIAADAVYTLGREKARQNGIHLGNDLVAAGMTQQIVDVF